MDSMWEIVSDDEYIDQIDEMDDSSDEAYPLLMANAPQVDDHTPPTNDNHQISYDRALPAQHVYLGSDLEEVSGRTVHDDNSYQRLPLLVLPKIVLIPGQTLPLQLFRPRLISLMKKLILSDRTFGLITSSYSDKPSHLSQIGTTAEIRSYSEDVNLSIKAEGRQRFRVIQVDPPSDGICMATVKILPEVVLGKPGAGIGLECLDRYHISRHNLASKKSLTQNTKNGSRTNFCAMSSWPPFVYDMYDAEILMRRIHNELQGWDLNLDLNKVLNKSPTEYSFWVAANLPLDDQRRMRLLEFDCAIQRLRFELHFIQKYSRLSCTKCNVHIAERNDIFSLSIEGPQNTYCNPNGYVHETITVHNARNLTLTGRPSTEFSWFPGYAWNICQCMRCGNHMGWKFTTDKNLEPRQFWGLCRPAVQPDWKNDQKNQGPDVY